MSFKELNLHPRILTAIEEEGYVTPTPIQQQAIPYIMNGRDVKGSAQTGTGKTAAYVLPTIDRILNHPAPQGMGPRALILVPTRELALQVTKEIEKKTKHCKQIKTVCIYGGVPYPVQNKQLSRPYDILVATPGRLIDHLDRGRIRLNRVEVFVLDEADRMLDMGFIDPVNEIAALTPSTRQTLLFSATLKGEVVNLARSLLKDPVDVSIDPEVVSHENIDQRLHYVDNLSHKHQILNHLLQDETIDLAIIFISTKAFADELEQQLFEEGHHVGTLHGDMNQRQRDRTVAKMRKGDIRFLIATDVASRGLDIQSISHVINFDLPRNVEDYVHRIGRTGRAGAKGVSISFAAPADVQLVGRIERFLGKKITPHVIPGMEPKAMPAKKSFSGRSRNFGHSGRPSDRNFRSGPRGGSSRRPGSGGFSRGRAATGSAGRQR